MSFELDAPAFTQWLEGYKHAWEARDAARAGALFAKQATYRETPFEAPLEGRKAIEAYWAKVTEGQKEVRFTYEVLACAGDTGLCRWHAAFTGVPGGEKIDLDGIFRCRFAEPELVSIFEEWWHIKVDAAGAPGK